jgi:hypothetical protein
VACAPAPYGPQVGLLALELDNAIDHQDTVAVTRACWSTPRTRPSPIRRGSSAPSTTSNVHARRRRGAGDRRRRRACRRRGGIDKALASSLLAIGLRADLLVLATDVDAV